MKQSTRAWIEFVERDIKAAKNLVEDDYVSNYSLISL